MTTSTTPSGSSPPAERPALTRMGGFLPVDPVLRRLSLLTLLNSFGRGLFFSLSVLYFTRIVGLSATSVGLGLTIAGLFGLVAGIPAGRVSDRFGSRPTLTVLWLACGAAMASYTLIGSYAGFLAAVICYAVVNQSGVGVRSALFADVLPPEVRVEGRAHLRMVTNVAMGVGGSLGMLALQADSRGAYTVVILANAAGFAVAALLVWRLPVRTTAAGLAGSSDEPVSRWRAVRDLPFITVTVLNGVLVLQYSLLEVGLPLWIAQHTDAPRWSVALIAILNCALVALLQVRITRGIDDLPRAVRAMGRSGVLLGLACLVFALTADLSPMWAVAVLALGAVIQVLAEVLTAAGGWTIGYALADARAQGVYQGVYAAGFSAATMAAPALITFTAIEHGTAGWVFLAVLFTVAGLAIRPAVAWARRTGEWRGEPA
ncbi:MFS transporter [Streptomyces sp. N2-109]|uniref:MFS transporter n=1 Tax=Streptomyces gossypii TaxID=2883101 RepID=A0ABT2JSI4_9ACTN|nr:MFS transporter [Streptomyces gossypii]MCT2590320.1 MFS transporter [Streptomyces gossypii]